MDSLQSVLISALIFLPAALFILGPPILGVIAAKDMNMRGQKGWGYGLLVLILFPVGLFSWMRARKKFPRDSAET